MFKITFKSELTRLDQQIDTVLERMSEIEPYSEEHENLAKQIETLYKAKSLTKDDRVSADTKLQVAANLIGIAAILSHERAHVVATKALSFVMKAR